MVDHAFGGEWTEEKLRSLNKYLNAYRAIFTGNPSARYFRTWYVDAFAGTGSRAAPRQAEYESNLFEDVYDDVDSKEYLDGSARIALGLQSPFDNYLFIEKSRSKATELRTSIERDFPALLARCTLLEDDSNSALRSWCTQRDWTRERAVVFLDPYGMQVDWQTVEALASTKAVDLWYLFPLGIGVSRLLTRDGNIDPRWRRRLNLVFGTESWQREFYEHRRLPGLFGEIEDISRTADEEAIESFIYERLEGLFAGVARGKILRNSRFRPLYLLCFACANKKGAPTAVKIAGQILEG